MWLQYDRRSVTPFRPEPDPNDIGMKFNFQPNIINTIIVCVFICMAHINSV